MKQTLKQILLIIFSSFFGISEVMSQYQYLNNGFESWDTNDEPTSWNSYPTAGGKLGLTVQNSEQITKSTDHHSGTYSAKLSVRDVKIVVHVAYANGMLTTGQISGNSSKASSPDNNNVSNIKDGYAMSFTGLPDSMSIWLKTSYTNTSQKTRLHVLLHDNAEITDPNTTWSSVVAVAGANVPAKNGVWQRTSIPFYYKGESLNIDCDVNGSSASQTHTPASTSKRPSYVLATIATNYMAGQGSAADVLLVDDVLMIYNSSLKSLTVNGASVSGFSKTKYSYTVNSVYTEGCVDCVSDGHGATVSESYDASTAIYTIVVKGDDYSVNSSNVHTYKIQFNQPQIYESLLTSLKVNGTSVSNFSSSTYAYTVSNAAYATSTVDYAASSDAKVEKSFDSSTNVLTITVKGGDYATNSKNIQTYKVTFHAPFESVLTSLKVNGTSVSNFSSSTYAYTVSNAAYATSTVDYVASSDAKVEKSFDATTNVLTITVKGGDYATNKSNTHSYKITFHASFGSVLTSLKVNGTSVANFSSSTYAYTVSDAAYATSIVDPVASSDATVEKSFDATTNVLTITVKGGDYATNKSNTHSYKITFHASFESFLTSLKVDGVDMDKFSSSLFSYTVKNTFVASSIKYTISQDASVEESFDATKNILTLSVMGGDVVTNASNKHVYRIQFYASSQLSDLRVDDVTIKGFEPSKLEYTVDVTYEFSKTDFKLDDTCATVSSVYDETTATLSIMVKGRDVNEFADNVHLYRVHYHLPYTSFLSALTNNGVSLEEFSSMKYDYVVDEVYARSQINYTADEFSVVEESFDANTNVLTIVVKSGDVKINPTNIHTYTIRFHAPYTSLLTDLAVNGSTIDGFASDKFDYVVNDVYYKTKLGVLTDDYASYDMEYDTKRFVLTIRVESGDIALDPKNYHEYKIQFDDHNVYNSQMLSVAMNGLLMEQFDKDLYDYPIEGSYADITFSYTTDSLTHVEESFDPESNLLTIIVKGGNLDRDTSNYHAYHFSFSEQFSYGAQITAIIYDGVSMEWFDKDVYEYTVDLDYNRAHFSYTTNSLADVYEFFDAEKLTLSVVVIGGDMDYGNMNEYIIHFASTSADENVWDEFLSLSYSDGVFSVDGSSDDEFRLYSLNGKLVCGGTMKDGKVEVGVLPHGLYIFRMNGKIFKTLF